MEKFRMENCKGKGYAEAYREYIDKNFRKGMTAQEFYDDFCDDPMTMWSMCRNNWEPTLFFQWNKPVKAYRVASYGAEEGLKIGLGYSGFYCIEFLI